MQNSHKWLSRFRLKSETWVYIPTSATLEEGKYLKELIELKWLPPENYYHLKSGGHVEAIRRHTNGHFFIHADLKKFFNNINRSRITRELKPYLGYEKARSVAMESTVSIPLQTGQIFALPFGFVQSTIIASLCLHKSRLGKVIQELDKIPDTTVSVYVDDIIISTKCIEAANFALSLITENARKSGLPLNEEKLSGPASSITAFNIELSSNSLIITSSRFNELLTNYKLAISDKQKDGIFGYVNSVNTTQAALLNN